MQPEMLERWHRLWRRIGAEGDADAHFADIALRYGEPHRAYHTLVHIEHCLTELDEVRKLTADVCAVELSLWLHDVIYDTQSKSNELRSAEYATRLFLKSGVSGPLSSRVRSGIMATASHEAFVDPDLQLIVDIDLAILGQSEERYELFEEQIRFEYNWVAEDAFHQGRASVLWQFYERPHIYATQHFREKYEDVARANLRRVLQRLGRLA